jgi:hypothetical protein
MVQECPHWQLLFPYTHHILICTYFYELINFIIVPTCCIRSVVVMNLSLLRKTIAKEYSDHHLFRVTIFSNRTREIWISDKYTLAYSVEARVVESQQPAVARQWPLNNNIVMVLSALLIAEHATMEYAMPSLSYNCTATEERYFLCGPCRSYINCWV